MPSQYITVEGEVREYHYLRANQNKKPYCPACGDRMIYIYTGQNRHDKRKIGFFCNYCNYVYIENKYKPFRVRWENNEVVSKM